MFTDLDNLDLTLQEGSPCIDTGDPTDTDPDGSVRDIGANWYGSYIVGDVNQDGSINVTDIVTIINFVLGNSVPTNDEFTAADMNVDGIINILDVIAVVNVILGLDLPDTVEWLERSFPELQVKERLNKLNIDWKKKKSLGN